MFHFSYFKKTALISTKSIESEKMSEFINWLNEKMGLDLSNLANWVRETLGIKLSEFFLVIAALLFAVELVIIVLRRSKKEKGISG